MRPRGAIPSPRHILSAAEPHRIVGVTPPQLFRNPARLSFWWNNLKGDCCTAEEAFAKACNQPEIFITDATVLAWATKNNVLNGAFLAQVLYLMQNAGFPQDGVLYNDGPYTSVDWTNPSVLQNAIAQGPVKIGVAADQLDTAVPDPPVNGWIATGFTPDSNEDHCPSLAGYGSISWLAEQFGVSVPSGIDGAAPAYEMFTWNSLGIIDVPSLLAITGEAWLRSPTTRTVIQGRHKWWRRHRLLS